MDLKFHNIRLLPSDVPIGVECELDGIKKSSFGRKDNVDHPG